ncbi:flippase [Candidatus Chlorohelix sp.]|uniref:flippase n=1 Tax=Candidatus Chlorohelix sp. TaxID=3139201 RepID=UPI0030575B6F
MVVRNSLYNLAAQIAIKLVSFGFMIFVVRQLGKIEFGKYAIATSFVAVLMVLCDLGLGSYVSREVARDIKRAEELLGNMIALRFILATIFIVFTTGSAWAIGYSSDIILAILLGSSSQLLFAVQSSLDSVLIGSQRLGASAFANLANQIVLVFSGVIILLLGFGFIGLSVASLLGILAATVLNSLTIRKRIGNIRLVFSPKNWFSMVRKGLPFGINQFALSMSYRLDSLILGWCWNNAVVGMYGAAYNLIFTLTTLSNSINLALFPYMSRQFAQNPEIARKNFGNYIRYLLMLSLPMATIGCVLAEPLAHLLFSASYTDSGKALAILVWALPLMFLNELLGYIAATVGMERQMATIRVVNAISNIGMNILVIPIYGLIGASITTVVTEAIGLTQFIWLMRSKKVFSNSKMHLFKIGVAATLAGLMGYLSAGLPVLLAGLTGLLVYLAGLILTGSINSTEIKLVLTAITHKNKPKIEGNALSRQEI